MALPVAARVAAIAAARVRRTEAAEGKIARTEWFINEVCDKIYKTAEQRVKIATELVRNKTVLNISRPVTKTVGRLSGRIVVSDRSKPGEYPKADTTLLMKSIFGEVRETSTGVWDGFVGMPLDYGLRLELKMNRSFLVRTLNEERSKVERILSGPVR